MAQSSQEEPQERYESLHQLQSPTSASTRYHRGAGSNGDGKGSNGGAQQRPQRPGKLAKMVRMASQLIVHGRTTSSGSITTQRKAYYGSTDSIPRVTRDDGGNEHAIVDDDEDDDPWHEEPWGQWRLILLTLGLAGAQLTWTVELGWVFAHYRCRWWRKDGRKLMPIHPKDMAHRIYFRWVSTAACRPFLVPNTNTTIRRSVERTHLAGLASRSAFRVHSTAHHRRSVRQFFLQISPSALGRLHEYIHCHLYVNAGVCRGACDLAG